MHQIKRKHVHNIKKLNIGVISNVYYKQFQIAEIVVTIIINLFFSVSNTYQKKKMN